MAKKKDKKGASTTDAVRSAVDQAFQAGQHQFSRERAQEIVDELAQAAGRVRDVLDDIRPPTGDAIRDLREQLERLEERVAALEKAPAPRARTSRSTTSRSTTKRSTTAPARAKRSSSSD